MGAGVVPDCHFIDYRDRRQRPLVDISGILDQSPMPLGMGD